MNFEFQGIDHIHIYVVDRKKSEIWYRDILGLTRTSELAFWAQDGGPLTIQNTSGSIHLALFENSDVRSTTVAFKVSSTALASSIVHLRSHGIEVEPIDHEVSWSIYFSDPDGNRYEVTTYEYEQFARKYGSTV